MDGLYSDNVWGLKEVASAFNILLYFSQESFQDNSVYSKDPSKIV